MTTPTKRAAGRESTHKDGSCAHAPGGPTIDLLAELDELRAMAKRAQLDLAAGFAVNGHAALRRIELKAADAARWARHTTTTTGRTS